MRKRENFWAVLLASVFVGGSLLPLSAQNATDAEPKAIQVGKGSYAEFPPPFLDYENKKGKSEYTGHIRKILEEKLYIDDAQKGKPIPTNDWWTDLIHSQYSGNLWAYPLMIKAVPAGINIYFPTEWNPAGNSMEIGPPLEIHGEVHLAPANTSPPILRADFEGNQFASGWTVEGKAFGDGPAQGSIGGQGNVEGFIGSGFADSMHDSDRSVGTLTSPPFTITHHFIRFLIAGGNHPETAYVELIDADSSKQLCTATGNNSEKFTWKTWDVENYKGKSVRIRAVDKESGGWGHIMVDQIIETDSETDTLEQNYQAFSPSCAEALNWGDWTLTMREPQDGTHYLDATFGRGMPYVWIELFGIRPHLNAPADAEWLDKDGKALTFPAQTDRWIVRVEGRMWGVFAPQPVALTKSGAEVVVGDMDHAIPYFVVCALPRLGDMDLFAQHAFAIPRDSRFDWSYDPAKGEVQTTWTLKTVPLVGSETNTIQGWLPHHYRTTRNDLKFAESEYNTPRGKLKFTVGTTFEIAWPFNGIPPMLPAPQEDSSAHSFKRERMDYYLNSYVTERADKPSTPEEQRYGGDTYWGGKDLTQYALYAYMAKELGNKEAADKLRNTLHDALSDWFTYTPGEKKHFFARYDRWKAMVGFSSSYGSDTFTDNHFHYGYFTSAAAWLGMLDPQFLKDYGPMARLVAKQYANWDRNDKDFPFLRTFDPWGGHSYAGGSSSGIGNNQESSSEAMQSWGGLFLLGVAMNDHDMTSAGAMGWAIERTAAEEYWNNYYGWKNGAADSNLSPNYKHSIVGIVGDQGDAFGTFFSGEPMHIYGIQWLPLSTILYYLGKDPSFSHYQLDQMLEEQKKKKPGFTFKDLKADWGDVTLGFILFADPEWAVEKMDELWDANDEIAHSKNIAGITYYMAHAEAQLGLVDWTMHTDLPASLVYHKAGANHVTVVAYQADAQEVTCHVFSAGRKIGEFQVPPGELTVHDVPISP